MDACRGDDMLTPQQMLVIYWPPGKHKRRIVIPLFAVGPHCKVPA